MEKRDDRALAIGLIFTLFGAGSATVGALLAFRLDTLRDWWLGLVLAIERTIVSRQALLDAQVTATGVFLAIAGVTLVLGGLIITRRALARPRPAAVAGSVAAQRQAHSGT
jgi:hypothetical protein